MLSPAKVIALAFAAICSLASCTKSPEPLPPWHVLTMEGLVQVMDDGEAFRPVQSQEALKFGSVLTTGAKSNARLTNGFQYIAIAANSRLRIPEDQHDGMTRILSEFGSMIFEVDHKKGPHFQVDTPLVTAVVKGTKFGVYVAPGVATVSVIEGLVEVRAVEGAARRDVPVGYMARVTKPSPREIEIIQRGAQDSYVGAGASGAAPADGAALNAAASGGGAISLQDSGPDGDTTLRGKSTVLDGAAPKKAKGLPGGKEARGARDIGAAPAQSPQAKSAEPVSFTNTHSQSNGASFSRIKKPEAKKADSPMGYVWYGVGFIVAWLVFTPTIAIGLAHMRRRRGEVKAKRADVEPQRVQAKKTPAPAKPKRLIK